MTQLYKKTTPPQREGWRILVFDFLGSSNQELRINLSDFNPWDINQIQDHSQQYQRPIYALRSNEQ
jgi:hypothetical protein